MRYLMILLLTACAARQPGEFDTPQHRADYAECEKNTPSGAAWFLGAGMAQAVQINDCMRAKGY